MTDTTVIPTSEDTTKTTPEPEAGAAPEEQEEGQPVTGEAEDDEPAIDPKDPDAIEMREAEAALKAEEEGKKDGTDDGGEPAGEAAKPGTVEADAGEKPGEAPSSTEKPEAPAAKETAGKPGEAEPERQGPDEQNMVPQSRVNKIAAQRNEAVLHAARLQGQNEAMRAMMEKGTAGPGGEQLPQGPVGTPEERIVAIREEKAASTLKYEEGELSAVEWQKQQDEFEDQVHAVRQEQLQPASAGPQAPDNQPQARDPYVESLMDGLEAKHPYSTEITGKLDWAIIESKALESLRNDGVELRKDAQSTLLLRTRMAEFTDAYGPAMTGKTLEEVKAAQAKKSPKSTPDADGQQAAPAQKKPGELSPQAQARKQKLDLAAGIAPDVANLGGASSGTELPTDEQILSMGEEEITALPAQAIRKFSLPTE